MNRILFYPHEFDAFTQSVHNHTILHIPTHDFRVQHLLNILKITEGAEVKAGVVSQHKGTLKFIETSTDTLVFHYTIHQPHPPKDLTLKDQLQKESSQIYSNHIHLIIGHLRPPVMARLIKDLSAMGIASINVYLSELIESSYFQSKIWDEVDKLLLLGAMQGDVAQVPQLRRAYSLKESLRTLDMQLQLTDRLTCGLNSGLNGATKLFCNEESEYSLFDFLHQHFSGVTGSKNAHENGFQANVTNATCSDIVILIGPERGLIETECELVQLAGFTSVSLGPRILRSEIAAHISIGNLCMCDGQ